MNFLKYGDCQTNAMIEFWDDGMMNCFSSDSMERQWFSMVAYHWPNDPIVGLIVVVVKKNPLPLVPIANVRTSYI